MKDDENIPKLDDIVDPAESVRADEQKPVPVSQDKPVVKEPTAKAKVGRPSSNSSAGVIAALILSLSAAAGSGYVLWQSQENEQQAQREVATLTQRLQLSNAQLKGLGQQLQQLQEQSESATKTAKQQQQKLTTIDELLQSQQKRIYELSTAEPRDWKLAEVEYLAGLANQRLQMGRDVGSALALLKDADKILFNLNDAGLYNVRQSIRRDIAKLAVTSRFDLEGNFQQLVVVGEQLPHLSLYKKPHFTADQQQPDQANSQDSSDWWAKVQQSLSGALDKLLSLVQVHSRDLDIKPLPSAADSLLLEQRLLLLVDEAKSSLLLAQQKIYRHSLEQLAENIQHNYLDDDQRVAVLNSINTLKTLNIVPILPDISGSQQAISQYIAFSLRAGKGITAPEPKLDPVTEQPAKQASSAVTNDTQQQGE